MLAKLLSLSSDTIFFSLLGGILPALFWLWYWLREDTLHPEPRDVIMWTFIAGALGAIVALPLEAVVYTLALPKLVTFIWVAIVEETAKYVAAYRVALRTSAFDEPVDALIYLITAALGFSAFENVLFIASTIVQKGFATAFLVSQLRFVGASLLHIVASASVGAALAFAFYKDKKRQKRVFHEGLILAILLHTAFNFFIIQQSSSTLLLTLSAVWMSVLLLLLLFEKVKGIRS